jgi:Protein of unknown function (DUF664)
VRLRGETDRLTPLSLAEQVATTTTCHAGIPGTSGHAQQQPPTVRWVVLHMIEETARHAGHLDIARELLDGRIRLGPR